MSKERHGHWDFRHSYKGATWGFYVCSECGEVSWTTKHKYCPECGAIMDEDSHEEPPKLTREERAFLESFRVTNGKYIYRDGNGRLWLTKDYEEIAELWGTMFPFITHDVENWWSVNELLCLKTE